MFFFDIFDGDVGNTIILGSIGSGKSVLLNTIANYSLKYKDTQVFYFDVDSSSRALCKANNGVFYDIGGERDNIRFQPLRGVGPIQKNIDIESDAKKLENRKKILELVYEKRKEVEENNLARVISYGKVIANSKEYFAEDTKEIPSLKNDLFYVNFFNIVKNVTILDGKI